MFLRFQSHDLNAGTEFIVLLLKILPIVKNFQMRPLVEQINPVVMELYEFGRLNFSLLRVFWHSRIIRIAIQRSNSRTKMSSQPKKLEIEFLQIEVNSVLMEDW